jgi:hypothetical protein
VVLPVTGDDLVEHDRLAAPAPPGDKLRHSRAVAVTTQLLQSRLLRLTIPPLTVRLRTRRGTQLVHPPW